jgi:hypothetical protein
MAFGRETTPERTQWGLRVSGSPEKVSFGRGIGAPTGRSRAPLLSCRLPTIRTYTPMSGDSTARAGIHGVAVPVAR